MDGLFGPKSKKVIELDKKIISSSYSREYEFVFKKAKGCYIWNEDGKKFLDFASGIAVANIGHNNPDVIKAIKIQLSYGTHAAFGDFYAGLPVKYAENLISLLPRSLNNVFLSNSGTESVEAALKLAKWHTKKKFLIAFKNAFHGRTMGSLSMTNSKKVQRERFGPFLPVKHVPFAYPYRMGENCSYYCLNELEKTIKSLKENVAAVFFEPIQGEGGYIVPPQDFIRGLRKLTKEYNILLAADEVQSGGFRTGSFIACEEFGIVPDIVSMSKSIGGGLPLGATIANKKIMDWVPGSHSNTFGGNLLACAAGNAALNFMKKNKLGENAKHIGRYILGRLEEMKEKYEIIGDVRGKGLMIGVELVKDKKSKKYAIKERDKIILQAVRKGLVLLPAGESTIRIAPPLIITEKEADKGLDILESAIKDYK